MLEKLPIQSPEPEPGYADRSEVAEFAKDLPLTYLLCREMGHNWKPWIARWNPESQAYERALKCSRCPTERWQTLSSDGAVLAGNYKYPDGYQHKGLGRIVGDGRDALRLESLMRAIASEEKRKGGAA